MKTQQLKSVFINLIGFGRMSIDDFVSNFTRLEVCHLTADAFDGADSAGTKPGESGPVRNLAGKVKQCWTFQKEFSTWRRNVSAGGGDKVLHEHAITFNALINLDFCSTTVLNLKHFCKQQSETFAMNPQFQVTVTLPELKDGGLFVVAVMQTTARGAEKRAAS